jgi:hypothetical protein
MSVKRVSIYNVLAVPNIKAVKKPQQHCGHTMDPVEIRVLDANGDCPFHK